MSGLKNSSPSSCMLRSLVYQFNTLESASSIPIEQYHWVYFILFLFLFTSNTLGSYFWCMVLVLSSPPFYTRRIQLPGNNDLCPPKICNNSKFWPFFEDVLSALNGSHIQYSSCPFIWFLLKLERVFITKLSLCIVLQYVFHIFTLWLGGSCKRHMCVCRCKSTWFHCPPREVLFD
jgi:hypothetical protein